MTLQIVGLGIRGSDTTELRRKLWADLFRHCIEESPTESPLLVTFSGTEFPKHYLLNSFRLRETIQSRTKLRLLQRPCDLPVVDFSMVLATSPSDFKWRRIFSFKIAIQDYQAFALPMNDGLGKVRLSSISIGA